MAFTGNENHTIPVQDAAAMNKRWRDTYPSQPKGIYFSQTTINSILEQEDCVGIRFFFALDTNGSARLTFCGVDANEDDIIGIVGDGGIICPPNCGVADELNSDKR